MICVSKEGTTPLRFVTAAARLLGRAAGQIGKPSKPDPQATGEAPEMIRRLAVKLIPKSNPLLLAARVAGRTAGLLHKAAEKTAEQIVTTGRVLGGLLEPPPAGPPSEGAGSKSNGDSIPG